MKIRTLPLLLIIVCGIAVAFPALVGRGCLIRELTGMHCPGCGGQRAISHLIRGDWITAAQANILVYFLLAGGILQLRVVSTRWRDTSKARGPLQINQREMKILLLCVFLFTVARNLPPLSSLHPDPYRGRLRIGTTR